MSGLFNPRWRLAWSIASAAITAFFVTLDWMLRAWTGQSPLAPTAMDLALFVGLGAAMGLAGMLWERYLLRSKRAFLVAVHRAPLNERLTWTHQRPNLLLNGWFFLGILLLIAGSYIAQVFVVPVLFAINAVQFMGNRRVVQQFNAELEQNSQGGSQAAIRAE